MSLPVASLDVEDSMEWRGLALPISFGVVVGLTILTLLSLVIASAVLSGGNGNDGDHREEDGKKVVFSMVWMFLMACVLAVMGGLTFFKNARTPFNIGGLGGATIMFASMALVVSLYMWETEEQEDNNGDGDNDGPLVISVCALCWIGTFFYILLSVFLLRSNTTQTENGRGSSSQEDGIKSQAYVHVLSDVWLVLAILFVLSSLSILVVSFVPLLREDADRVREEGYIWNFILVVLWMFLVATAFAIFGWRVFRGANTTSKAIGALTGSLFGLASMEFLLAVLFATFSVSTSLFLRSYSVYIASLALVHSSLKNADDREKVLWESLRSHASASFLR